jgi:hypothetical protein
LSGDKAVEILFVIYCQLRVGKLAPPINQRPNSFAAQSNLLFRNFPPPVAKNYFLFAVQGEENFLLLFAREH